ncbi:restriction endonuclease [Raineyella fluvialis]|uniref:Restriction endonuclease n=1 Tax=Raineyella fluvialis TaxID=2662261 RepID=A0A5Q2FD23_9ACTN|nr:restriction endonuclease [Raineyella fluvialis]QGF22605.1 restriction endonuclease [Raineyella fluvialis]
MTEVPTWEQFMAPILQELSDGIVHKARDLREVVADRLGLSEQARKELIPSGQARWENRANWALSYLGRFGAAYRPIRGSYQITDSGRALLEQRATGITVHDLKTLLPPTITAITSGMEAVEDVSEVDTEEIDPVEQIENGVARLQATVGADLLVRLHSQDPAFFEQAVLDLLMAMGYGGAEGKATRTQLSNDGGIDGIVDQDALGLSRIYVQAKRYALDASVGRPEVQAFVGALHGNQANQGVFITTGRFASGARAYAESVPTRVILIDGQRLASLMVRYGVGVQVRRTVQIVEVDEDFFE